MKETELNVMDRIPVLKNMWVQLLICIICDIIGMVTYIIPGVGELADVVWAPIQTYVIYTLVGMEPGGKWLMALSFAEEIIPLASDWIPSCLIAWLYKVIFT